MNNLLDLLKTMISAPGLSGYEAPIRQIISQAWEPLTDELITSRIGSLHGLHKGNGTEPRPGILLAAHMDAIGLMVKGIQDDFLRLTEIGGIDPRVLPGQLVTVHARKDLPGVIVQPPDRLLPDDVQDNPVPLEHLFVDVGLPASQLKNLVRAGDLISFAGLPVELSNGKQLVGHSLDNRASVAALTHCLELLQTRPHYWDVWAVATVQEEETLGGAFTSAYHLRPQLAVAVDVTFAKGPGSSDHNTFPIDKGPTLGWGPNIHPGLYRQFKELAEKLEIPYQVEVMPRHSGTDAMGLQITAEGIPTMVLSIPIRYMHTPVEMVSLQDIKRAGRLLAEFIAQLEADFLDKLSVDE